jgi:hypothetical protein
MDTNILVEPEKYKFNLFKLAVLAVFSIYFLSVAMDPSQWSFLDNVDLIIHETGHFIFMMFGSQFISITGGTIAQILSPLFFTLYFYATDQKYSASLVLFWLGQSFLNVSVYANDAVNMSLPLIGGPNVIHDWNYMFKATGLLSSTHIIASIIQYIGILIVSLAIMTGAITARERKASKFI